MSLSAMIYKEAIQVRRDPATRVVFVIPMVQLLVFGYAIDTDVRDISTVVFDADRRAASRDFIARFENTDVFRVTGEVEDVPAVREAIVAGRASAGIIIPPDFSEDLLLGRAAQVQVLIDGSNNTVATQALQVSSGIAMETAIRKLGQRAIPISLRPKVLFNEDVRSANFFVPALVGVILQLITVFLTAFSIVRERERGTLEQLMVTPVTRRTLILGKLVPYAVLGMVETGLVLLVMVYVFEVPVNGDKALLLALSALFLLPSLGLGILISTAATNQAQATQMALLIMLPSILLSGFVFPREQMPGWIYAISCLIPVTYYIEILRGIILRGATAWHLWYPTAMLAVFGVVIFTTSAMRFQKRLN